jgi:glutathione S-transferase
VLDPIAWETARSFLAREHVTIADCLALATLQIAEGVYGVPLPSRCPVLAKWHAMFAQWLSGTPSDYPAPLLDLTNGLPAIRPPTAE